MPRAKTTKAKTPAPARLTVTQIRSAIGFNKNQRVVLEGLGIRRIRHTVEVPDTPAIRGMLLKVRHLVTVEAK